MSVLCQYYVSTISEHYVTLYAKPGSTPAPRVAGTDKGPVLSLPATEVARVRGSPGTAASGPRTGATGRVLHSVSLETHIWPGAPGLGGQTGLELESLAWPGECWPPGHGHRSNPPYLQAQLGEAASQ